MSFLRITGGSIRQEEDTDPAEYSGHLWAWSSCTQRDGGASEQAPKVSAMREELHRNPLGGVDEEEQGPHLKATG